MSLTNRVVNRLAGVRMPISLAFLAILVLGIIMSGFGYLEEKRDAFTYSGSFMADLLIKNGKLDNSVLNPQVVGFWTNHAMVFINQDRIAIATLLAPLALVTNLDPGFLAPLPLPSLVFLIIGGLIAREFTKNKLLIIAFLSYLVIELNINMPYDFKYHNVAFIYLLLVVYAVVKLLKRSDQSHLKFVNTVSPASEDYNMGQHWNHLRILKSIDSKRREIGNLRILIILGILAAVPMYYTFAGFNAIFLITVASVIYLSNRIFHRVASVYYYGTISLFALIAVILFVSDPIVLSQINSGYLNNASTNSGRLLTYVADLIRGSTSSLPEYSPLSSDRDIYYLSVVILFITLASTIIFVFKSVIKRRITVDVYIVAGALAAALLEPVMYFGVLSFVFRFATFVLPLFAMYSIYSLLQHNRTIRVVGIALILSLVFLNGVRYYLVSGSEYYSTWEAKYYYTAFMPSSNWALQHLSSGSIVSSHPISGIIFSQLANYDKENLIDVEQFGTSTNALDTTDPSLICQKFFYREILMSDYFRNHAIFGALYGENSQIPPIGDKVYTINDSTCVNKQYDDGVSSIYVR